MYIIIFVHAIDLSLFNLKLVKLFLNVNRIVYVGSERIMFYTLNKN